MSFSSEVKDELIRAGGNKTAQKAEFLAAFTMLGRKKEQDGIVIYEFCDENPLLVKKYFTFLKKSYNIYIGAFAQINIKRGKRGFGLRFVSDKPLASSFSAPVRAADCFAFLRGRFLACGSISDPARAYQLEFSHKSGEQALMTKNVLDRLGIGCKVTTRKNASIVYIKDGSSISELLAALGAAVSMMSFENTRAMNETRGMINRRVNCEVGNLRKSAEAGKKQQQAIEALMASDSYELLPDNLREIAELRVRNPEASLQELGDMLDPPLGRSGVNHRLQKLLGMADNLKTRQEEV